LRQSLGQSIDLHIGMLGFQFVIVVLLLVALNILSTFSLRSIQLNVQILNLLGKLLLVRFPLLLVLLIPLSHFLDLVLLDFDSRVLVLFGCR